MQSPGLAGPARRSLVGFVAALIVIAGVTCPSRADNTGLPGSVQLAPVADLFGIVHEKYPGRILTVELEPAVNPVYEVKLLTNAGVVLVLGYDAVTLDLTSVNGVDRSSGQERPAASGTRRADEVEVEDDDDDDDDQDDNGDDRDDGDSSNGSDDDGPDSGGSDDGGSDDGGSDDGGSGGGGSDDGGGSDNSGSGSSGGGSGSSGSGSGG